MSKPQKHKGPKSRQLVCTKPKHESKGYAKLQIASMKRNGLVGTSGLAAYRCPTCSRAGREVFHVGHRRREIA